MPLPSLEEISSLSHSIIFLYFFALISEEGFLICPCFLWNSAFRWECLSFNISVVNSFCFLWSGFLKPFHCIFRLSRKHPWRRQRQPTPVLLPGKSHGRRSLVGCSPWGREESDTTERLDFHFSLSCIGEGNGNPLQCLPGESQGWGSLVGCRLWGHTESDTTKVT